MKPKTIAAILILAAFTAAATAYLRAK